MARKSLLTPEETALIRKQVFTGNTLRLPGWDDVIHVTPDFMLTPHDLAARKYSRALRMIHSPGTPFAKSVTWAMTQVDNIQDACVTASVALRLGALAIPALKPAALLAGRAADSINLANLAKPAMQAGRKGKRGLEAKLAQSPGYYAGRVKNAVRLRSALPNIPEVLQILQTSDQLTGIGLSLGAVIGAPLAAIAHVLTPEGRAEMGAVSIPAGLTEEEMTEYIMAQPQEERGKATERWAAMGLAALVGATAPGVLALSAASELIGKALTPQAGTPAEQFEEAANALDAASWLTGGDQALSPEDHLLIALAHHYALGILANTPRTLSLALMGKPQLARIITTRPSTNATTRCALAAAGIDPNSPGTLPLRGAPPRVSLRDAQAEIMETAPRVLPLWREDLATDDQEIFASALCAHAAGAPWNALEGNDAQFIRTWSPIGRALITAADYGLQIPQDFPDNLVDQLLTKLSETWSRSAPWQPDPAQASRDFAIAIDLLTPGRSAPAARQ